MPDGTVSDIVVRQSLDQKVWLDYEAYQYGHTVAI
jgi:hypothetical protein